MGSWSARLRDRRCDRLEHALRRSEPEPDRVHDGERSSMVEPRCGSEPLQLVLRCAERNDRSDQVVVSGCSPRHLGLRLSVPDRPVRHHDRRSPEECDRRALQDRLGLRARPDQRPSVAQHPRGQGPAEQGPAHLADSAGAGRGRVRHAVCEEGLVHRQGRIDRRPPGEGGLHLPAVRHDARSGNGPECTRRLRLEPVLVQPGDPCPLCLFR